jgi:hypothetical protein
MMSFGRFLLSDPRLEAWLVGRMARPENQRPQLTTLATRHHQAFEAATK